MTTASAAPHCDVSHHAALGRCPRCGYDLSGVIASWEGACPLEGRCSECGVDFHWGDLLNERRRHLPWLYEHANRWWNFSAAWKTTLTALTPWRFWRQTKVHHPIRLVRLALWLPVTIAPLLLLLAIALLIIGALTGYAGNRPLPSTFSISAQQLNAFDPIGVLVRPDNSAATITLDGRSTTVPLHFHTSHDPKLVKTPIGDVLVTWHGYIGPWYAPNLPAPVDSSDAAPARVRYPRETIIAPNGDVYDDLIILSAAAPRRWASMSVQDAMVESLTNPIGILLGSQGIYRFIHSKQQEGLNAAIVGCLVTVGYSALAGAIVFVSPSEWRRKSIRTAHLLRIGAYSFAAVPILIVVVAIGHIWNNGAFALWLYSNGNVFYSGHFQRPTHVLPASVASLLGSGSAHAVRNVLLVWLSLHWWFGLSRGMKLRRPIFLWIFVTTAGILGALAVLKFINIDWELIF